MVCLLLLAWASSASWVGHTCASAPGAHSCDLERGSAAAPLLVEPQVAGGASKVCLACQLIRSLHTVARPTGLVLSSLEVREAAPPPAATTAQLLVPCAGSARSPPVG